MRMSVNKDITLDSRGYEKNGVPYKEYSIPGVERRGVLAPEIIASILDEDKKPRNVGLMWGDGAGFRSLPAQDEDIAVAFISEDELIIEAEEYNVPVTCYRTKEGDKKRPALVYFHGGGFTMGSRKSVEHSMRLLAQYSRAAIFSVEYRLAPEHPFPCAVNDAWNVLRWIWRNSDHLEIYKDQLLISGDSAGGNLAAACSRRDRNSRTDIIRGQILIYPVLSQCDPIITDHRFSLTDYEICPEQRRWIEAEILSLKNWTDNYHLYTRNSREDHAPDASPLFDTDFCGIPMTWIGCAEFDYLTYQAKLYAELLAKSGVDVNVSIYRGMTHGFMNHLGQYPQAEMLHKEIASVIERMIYG